MKTCPNCGREVIDTAVLCRYCGRDCTTFTQQAGLTLDAIKNKARHAMNIAGGHIHAGLAALGATLLVYGWSSEIRRASPNDRLVMAAGAGLIVYVAVAWWFARQRGR